MRVLFIDDEPSAHVNFRYNIQSRKDITSLHCFFTAEEVLRYAEENRADCAFLDIGLRGPSSGIELAKKLKALQPHMEIAFVTASDQYTRASYQLGGRAYLTKPYAAQELEEALDLMGRLTQTCPVQLQQPTQASVRVKIRTFGNFDLIVDGRAVAFKIAKAKEALAFLVDHMGGSVNGAQLFFALWEAQEYTTTTSIYVRRTMRALKEELTAMGLAEILVIGRNTYSIDVEQVYCDSYALLNGSPKEATLFNGEYMMQYTWGEATIPLLERAAKKSPLPQT